MSNFSDEQLEKALRNAPQPQPPRGLKDKLISQARGNRAKPGRASVVFARETWFDRWWRLTAAGAFCFICAVVMAIQQNEIHRLKQSLEILPADSTGTLGASAAQPKASDAESTTTVAAVSASEQEEIEKLKEQATELKSEIAKMEQLKTENQTMRAQLAAPAANVLSADEVAEMDKARERALNIQCVNNMKQMGLAVRVWGSDNLDAMPPDMLSMSNELSTPIILHCPSDTNRPAARNFASYTDANCSYEYLGAANGTNYQPEQVLFICPIHGNICLCDGSVQSEIAKKHPEFLVQREGKIYFEPHYGSQ